MNTTREYESIVIVNGALQEAEANGVVTQLKGILSKHGASNISDEVVDKRPVAVQDRKKKLGVITQIRFSSDNPNTVAETRREWDIADNLLRYQIVRCSSKKRKFKGNLRDVAKNPVESKAQDVSDTSLDG